MKVVMLMFDSLNRHMLPPYGCDWVHAPNFRRLAERSVTFDRSYVCSMPCMPARRELHTGRSNFLHRSWGPIEPFDDSVPEMLKNAGIYTHLATDHQHYFEDGGATYHTRYNTWQFARGQEGDAWIPEIRDPDRPDSLGRNAADDSMARQDWVNRSVMHAEADQPQAKTLAAGLDFLRRNHDQDRWFLQIETFDPHEPFFSQRKYKDLYSEHYDRYRQARGKHFDWPMYRAIEESDEQLEHLRFEYAALLGMCDATLGDVLDAMDAYSLWDDTMLIVWTDHGFLLGEHQCCAKIWMPFYEEVAHTPFFVWDPRCRQRGQRRQALVQPSIDLGPTLLEFFGLEPTADMRGKSLSETIASDAPVRQAGIFGIHGGQVNVTDGRHVYMRAAVDPDHQPIFDYTLMPTRMRQRFSAKELQNIELSDPLAFTKGVRPLKIPAGKFWGKHPDLRKNLLYDLESDPGQQSPIDDAKIEARMIEHLRSIMTEHDAPPEQYERLGIAPPAPLGRKIK
jgi:arylsulfatase A-like enzyme